MEVTDKRKKYHKFPIPYRNSDEINYKVAQVKVRKQSIDRIIKRGNKAAIK